MATENDGMDIKINLAIESANSAQSLQELKKSMRELQGLALQVGDSGAGFDKLTQAVANGKEKIVLLNQSISTLKGSGVDRLESSFAVLGKGLVSFDTEKISIGFKGLGMAMSAIPIFLLIEGIKILWDNLDKVTGFLNGSTAAMKSAKEEYEKTSKAADLMSDALGRQVDLMEAQGKSEKDILKVRQAKLDQDLKSAESAATQARINSDLVKGNDSIYESYLRMLMVWHKWTGQTELAEENEKEIAQNKKERNEANVKSIEDSEKKILDIVGKAQVLQAEDITTDREKRKTDKEKADKDAETAEKKHQAELLKAHLALEEELAKIAQTTATANDTLYAHAKKLQDDEELRLAESEKRKLTIQRDRDKETLRLQYEASDKGTDAYNDYVTAKMDIDAKYDADVEADRVKTLKDDKALAAQRFEEQKADDKKATEENKKKVANDFKVAQGLNDGLQGLSDLFFAVKSANTKKGSAEDLKNAKEQFKINKALSMASAVISGIQGTINAFSSGSAVPVLGAVLGPIYAVAAAAAAAANIAKIAGTQFDSSGFSTSTASSSVVSPERPSAPTPATDTPQPNGPDFSTFGNNNSNVQSNQHINVTAVVVSQEITNSQTANSYANSLGSL